MRASGSSRSVAARLFPRRCRRHLREFFGTRGAALVVELPGTELVHGGAPFEGEGALHQAFLAHLPRQEEHRHPLQRRAERDPEGEGTLPAPYVAGEEDQVAPPEPAAEELVDR